MSRRTSLKSRLVSSVAGIALPRITGLVEPVGVLQRWRARLDPGAEARGQVLPSLAAPHDDLVEVSTEIEDDRISRV